MYFLHHKTVYNRLHMTTKKLALLSFGIPFILGGGFIGIGVLTDQLQHPDDPMFSIILSALWSTVSSGTILGLISLAVTFLVVAIYKSFRKSQE